MTSSTKPEEGDGLGRSLKSRHVSMIAIGGIIGAGLFVGSSTSIATVGPAVVVSYAIAGLLVLLVMRILSEMAISEPGVGSFTEFVRLGLGDWGGFVTGWLYWYFWVVVVAIEAIAGAVILRQWLPFETWQIGLVLLTALTAVNLTSTRSYGEFEFWLSSLKVAGIIAFIAIAGAYAFGLNGTGVMTFANLVEHGGFAPSGPVAVLAGVTSVIFALTGAEIATIAAAEADEPEKTIAKITSSVALRILLFYVVSIFLIVSVVPWTSIQAGISPFTTALEGMNIPGAGVIMSVIVLIAVLSCLNSGLYVTSRVLFVLASRGDAPQFLVDVNSRRVPVRAILVGSLFGYLALGASVLSPQVVFSFLVNASGAIMLFIYVLLCLAYLKRRKLLDQAGVAPPAIRMWFHPWSTYGVILGIGGVLLAMAGTPELASQLYSSLFVMALVVACYLVVRRRRARLTALASR